jgi:hypothetical protein
MLCFIYFKLKTILNMNYLFIEVLEYFIANQILFKSQTLKSDLFGSKHVRVVL